MGSVCHSIKKKPKSVESLPFINENGILESRVLRHVSPNGTEIEVPAAKLQGDLLSPRSKTSKMRKKHKNKPLLVRPFNPKKGHWSKNRRADAVLSF